MLLSFRPGSIFKLFTAGTLIAFWFVFFRYSTGEPSSCKVDIDPPETKPLRPAEPADIGIPEKIWYKVGPRGITNQSWIDSCLNPNPTYEHEIMTDLSSEMFVKKYYAFRLDIIETYLALPFPILKVDFLKYLLLFAKGGIWSDLDVSCENIPIREWIPAQYKQNASLVVGWEFDAGWQGGFVRQFASWVFMAKPNSPHMMMVINDLLFAVRQTAEEHGVRIQDLKLDMIGDIVDFTGPRRMTHGIMRSLELTLGRPLDEEDISNLMEPKLVADVLILPGFAFANLTNWYLTDDGEPLVHGPPLVTHHYAGSWRNEHGGELR